MKKLQQIIKQYFTLFIVAPLVLFTIVVLISQNDPLTLFPMEQDLTSAPFRADTYADNEVFANGSSISKVTWGDERFSYSYKLTKATDSPYAGVLFDFVRAPHNPKPLDISDYTHIFVKLDLKGSHAQDIYIKTFVEGITTIDNQDSYGYLRAHLEKEDGDFSRQIPISEFVVPDWWFAKHKIQPSHVSKIDYTQVLQVNIQNSVLGEETDSEVSVSVSEITFLYSPKGLIAKLLLVYGIYLFLVMLLRFKVVRVGKAENNIVIAYNTVALEEEKNSGDVQRIAAYIADNFAHSELTVETLAKGAGVSAAKVPTLLKEKYQMNFKQYLNTVRITEAKRLLTGTDQQIVTIAHTVGYNNIPHFNRTFKQLTGLSPKQFRQHPSDALELHVPGTTHKDN